MTDFWFYTTLGCHLCEQAQQMLAEHAGDLSWQAVEIADSPTLIDRYGLVIPVLHCIANGRELKWPFSPVELTQWINAQRAALG